MSSVAGRLECGAGSEGEGIKSTEEFGIKAGCQDAVDDSEGIPMAVLSEKETEYLWLLARPSPFGLNKQFLVAYVLIQ